ncbi:MAG: glycosyltransferase family 39 protein [Chloroflexota bacterium]|nr:glycosyltransferase family 39 protein [Chloroflexota bacterium]
MDITRHASRFTYPALIPTCFVLLALACGLIVPPFENLDEIEHFEVVRYIAEVGNLPVHRDPDAESYRYRQEASQPPLYHLLSAGLVKLLDLPTDDAAAAWRLNPRVACGPGAVSLYDNRAVLYHDPNAEAFPWESTLLTLHVLRALSTLLQVITVATTYALARLAFPQRRKVALMSMAIVAFNPQFLLVASGINNDNLVTPLVTVGLYLLLRVWQDGLSVRRAIGLGVLTGLAGLSKLSGWGLLGLAGLVTLAMVIRSKKIEWRFLLTAILIPTIALLLAGWWFWHNWQLYGDPTALQPMLELVGVRDGSLIQPFLETSWMFRSFWGQIPCSFYPSAFYAFYAAFTSLALGGLAWGWRRLTSAERAAGVIMGGWFILIVASWVRWDTMTPAPGGRLLFPALPSVALLMALGISLIRPLPFLRREAFDTGYWGLGIGLLALMALWTVSLILPGFFAPPPRYPDAGAVRPAHSLDATLGDTVQLLGYDVALDKRPGAILIEPEPTLDVTLYWQSLVPMVEDYVMALQLVSPVAGDTTLRWNYNSWPGRGNYPTSAWQPGEVIADRYRFRLPEADFPTQAWDVHMALYQMETGERLPVELAGTTAGDRVVLAQLRVPGHPPRCPEEGILTSEVHFGEAVALTHAVVAAEQGDVQVMLCWEALQPLPDDYTVFVHLEDASGSLISTGDGPPMQGAFSTSMWHPGDVVLDVHHLIMTPAEEWVEEKEGELGASGQHITVGLYNPKDNMRLPAYVEGVPVSDAAVSVWPNRP